MVRHDDRRRQHGGDIVPSTSASGWEGTKPLHARAADVGADTLDASLRRAADMARLVCVVSLGGFPRGTTAA